jgi:hypothetical protein
MATVILNTNSIAINVDDQSMLPTFCGETAPSWTLSDEPSQFGALLAREERSGATAFLDALTQPSARADSRDMQATFERKAEALDQTIEIHVAHAESLVNQLGDEPPRPAIGIEPLRSRRAA